jgi:hypothetical protein
MVHQHNQPESEKGIPNRLRPFFKEYNPDRLDLEQDANLIIQRTLEFGDWEDVRWLFRRYGRRRISAYVRRYGQRGLSRVTFNYWRRLLGITKWRKPPFDSLQDELWNR